MRTPIIVGVVVVLALLVMGVFFIFNPFATSAPVTTDTSVPVGTPTANPPSSEPSTGSDQLVMQDETIGTGATAQAGDVITVNYTGKLANGTVFDTSVGKQPFQFTLGAGQVIAGWDQGVAGMKVGGKRILIIPPSLAYGAQGAGGVIPPNATLTFEVELLSVTPASQAAPVPEGPAAQ